MQGWTELERKAIQIGKCSRGFLIPKEELSLKSGEDYIIRIIPKSEVPLEDLTEKEGVDKYEIGNCER